MRKRGWLTSWLMAWLLLLVAGAGCVGREVGVPDSVAAERVLLVVLAGDNSLSAEVAWRLDALRAGWQKELGPLFVLADSHEQEAPALYRMVCDEGGEPRLAPLATFPHLENSASEELWRATFALLEPQIHPRAGVGLVLFSHGSGWLPEGTLSHPRSFLEDQGRELSLEGLVRVLPEERLDFLLFDMCFTAGVEVAYALRAKVPYMVASSAEMLSPGFVSLYRSHLPLLYGELPRSLVQWGELYAAEVEQQEGVYRSGTLSVLELSQMEALAEWVRRYDKGNRGDGVAPVVEHYDRTLGAPLFYDLGGYLEQQCESDAERAYLRHLLGEVVLYKWHTEAFMGRPLRAHSGLTLYLPSARYPYLNKAYEQTAWWQRVKG